MDKKLRLPLIWIIYFFCLYPSIKAQQNDLQCWPSAQINLEVIKDLKVMLEEEVRWKENCTQMDRQINDLGMGYKINKFCRVDLFYRILANSTDPGNYQWQQGLYANLALKYGAGRFLFGYRARLQSSKVEFIEGQDRFLSNMTNRHKFTIEYNIKNCPLVPFAEGELFFHFFDCHYELSDLRTWIGITYAPGKIHEFSLKYGMDKELMVGDPLTAYIIAFNYAINLKLRKSKK
jgi:hypothetical protein